MNPQSREILTAKIQNACILQYIPLQNGIRKIKNYPIAVYPFI